jgi:hypothetical protein
MDNIKPVKLDNTEELIQKALEDGTFVPASEQIKTELQQAAQDNVEARTLQVTPEQMVAQTLDSAAKLLDHYVPIFESGIKKLSSNQLRRILKNLVEYPLSDKAYKPKEEEGTLFLIGSRILEAKHTLIMYTMFSQVNQTKQKIEENSNTVEVKPPTE